MKILSGLVLIAILATANAGCPKQGCFGTIHKHKYYIKPEYKYNFFESVSECTKRNMTLLTIDSAEKVNEVNSLLAMIFGDKPMPNFYIGAFSWSNFNFVWISSGEPLVYTNWYPGEPNLKIENCVNIGRYKKGKWNNIQCATKIGYICE